MRAWRTVVSPHWWCCSTEGNSSIQPSCIKDLKHSSKSLTFSLYFGVFVRVLVVVSTKVGTWGGTSLWEIWATKWRAWSTPSGGQRCCFYRELNWTELNWKRAPISMPLCQHWYEGLGILAGRAGQSPQSRAGPSPSEAPSPAAGRVNGEIEL